MLDAGGQESSVDTCIFLKLVFDLYGLQWSQFMVAYGQEDYIGLVKANFIASSPYVLSGGRWIDSFLGRGMQIFFRSLVSFPVIPLHKTFREAVAEAHSQTVQPRHNLCSQPIALTFAESMQQLIEHLGHVQIQLSNLPIRHFLQQQGYFPARIYNPFQERQSQWLPQAKQDLPQVEPPAWQRMVLREDIPFAKEAIAAIAFSCVLQKAPAPVLLNPPGYGLCQQPSQTLPFSLDSQDRLIL